jgi:hypothetical protein
MKRLCLALVLSLAAVPAVWAHGNMDHILGIVVKVKGDTLTIQRDGQTMEVLLKDSTKYEDTGSVGKKEDLRVGDRVAIHAQKIGGKEIAEEVRFRRPVH